MSFDPYYKWLGIPPSEQPPNYYRLLSLSLFEQNADAIENAADRQMRHVRTFQAGPQGADSQRLLNEIAAARLVLLDASRRRAYDEQLRAQLAVAAPMVVEVPPAPPAASGQPQELIPSIVTAAGPAVQVQPREPANRRPPKDLTVEILKIVGGGIAGIVLASVLLRLFFGIDMTGLFPVEPPQKPPIVQRPKPIHTTKPLDDSTQPRPADRETATTDSKTGPEANTDEPPPGRAGGKKKKGKKKPPSMPSSVVASNDPPILVESTPATPPPVETSDPPATPASPPIAPAPESAGVFRVTSNSLQPRRLQAPSDAERLAAEQALEAAYQLSKLKDDAPRQSLATELFGVGTSRSTPPAQRWVTLKAAADLAADVGDAKLVAQAMDALAQTFELDTLGEEATLLTRAALGARTSEQVQALVEASRTVIQLALVNHDYVLARDLASAVRNASDRPTGQPFRKFIFDGQREIVRQQEAWYAYREATAKLATAPDDVDANLASAKWWIFERGDWDAALPHLSKTGKPLVKIAADLDAAKGNDWLAIGNAWYDAGMAEPVTPLWLLRAQGWYAVIDKAQISGLDGATVDRRMEELAKNVQLPPLEAQITLGRGAARVHSSLAPVVRRHCVLLLPFERADFFHTGKALMVCDRSGQANHGAAYGVKSVAGQAGMALEFAGPEHYVQCPDQPSLNPEGALTICAWVKQAAPVQPGGMDDLLSKEEWGGGTGRGYSLRIHQGRPNFDFGSGSDWLQIDAPQPLDQEVWVHVAGVYDGQNETLLVNGVEVASQAVSKSISKSPQPLRIGRGPFAQDRRFHGVIDEVAVFGIALTAGDLQAIIDLGRSGKSLAE